MTSSTPNSCVDVSTPITSLPKIGSVTHHLSKPYMQLIKSGNMTRSTKLGPRKHVFVYLSISNDHQ